MIEEVHVPGVCRDVERILRALCDTVPLRISLNYQ